MDFNSALVQVRKDMPSVGDVHVPNAGNRKPRRSKLKDTEEIGKFDMRVPVSETRVVKGEDGADRNLVFGWASIVEKDGQMVIDVQGDGIDEADLETAFYNFVKEARNAGEMHGEFGSHVGTCVECMVFTKEKQKILKIDLGFVGAWIGFEVTPDLFAKIKSGEYRAFSIGGEGVRRAIT